jgi:hypothetical protein
MALPTTANPPNTILLGGGMNAADGAGTYINDKVAVEPITPGMLLELHDDSGTPAWGVHDTADDPCPAVVALEQTFLNLGVNDAYADGDLVYACALRPGSMFWGIVPSGQNISVGERLQSNGDGKLKAEATGDVRFVSHTDTGGAVTEDTRVKVEVL